MPYGPNKHGRRSMRLKGYDYSTPGAYFVTLCTQDRSCLFGEVATGEMRLNEAGRLVQAVWEDLPKHYAAIALDAFTVMPNHIHGIIVLTGIDVGAGFKPAPTTTPKRHALPEIVRGFKTFSARSLNDHQGTHGRRVWQRNYYEHVVRSEESLDRIRE